MNTIKDYHNRDVRIGDCVVQFVDGTIGMVRSFTSGSNPRIQIWSPYSGWNTRVFAITGRWCLMLPPGEPAPPPLIKNKTT